jgi:hypothetical protein
MLKYYFILNLAEMIAIYFFSYSKLVILLKKSLNLQFRYFFEILIISY